MAETAPNLNDKVTQNFVAQFLQEDKDMCERVQRGMGSSHHQGGKLLEMERIVVDFHQYLAKHLFNSPTSDLVETESANMFK
jgi:choline monooxygenase